MTASDPTTAPVPVLLITGPVGVGKTFLATALGHAAVRRRYTVHFERCDRLLKRLRASRLDNSHDAEMRKLIRVDLLIVDDFALESLDAGQARSAAFFGRLGRAADQQTLAKSELLNQRRGNIRIRRLRGVMPRWIP